MNNITTEGVVLNGSVQAISEQVKGQPIQPTVNSVNPTLGRVTLPDTVPSSLREALVQLIPQGAQQAVLTQSQNNEPLLLLKGLNLKLPQSPALPDLGDVSVQFGKENGALYLQFIETQVALIKPPEGSAQPLVPSTGLRDVVESLFKEILTKTSEPLSLESLRDLLLKTKVGNTAEATPTLFQELQAKFQSSTLQNFTSTLLTKSVFSSPERVQAVLKAALLGTTPSANPSNQGSIAPQKALFSILQNLTSNQSANESIGIKPEGGQTGTTQMSSPESRTPESPGDVAKAALAKEVVSLATKITEALSTKSSSTQPLPSTQLTPLLKELAPLLPQLERFFPHLDRSVGFKSDTLGQIRDLIGKVTKESSATLTQLDRISLRNSLAQLTTALTSQASTDAQSNNIEQQLQLFQSRASDGGTQETAGKEKLRGMVENFVQGQEALRRLNPLMQQVGEPVFLLIPGFLQNFLQHLEVNIYPKADETGEESKDGSGGGYQRLSLSFSFPNIGGVEVDIAYSSSHALLSIASESEEVVEFLDSNLHLLKEPLNKLGFSRTELITRLSTSPEPKRPQWIEEVLGVKAIA